MGPGMAVADFLTHAQTLLNAGKISGEVFNHLKNVAGTSAVGEQNISNAQRQTPYSGESYINQYAPKSLEETKQLETQRRQGELFNEDINRRTAQQNTYNTLAVNDQSNRATAANNILSAYQRAREANQNFIGSLSGTIGRY